MTFAVPVQVQQNALHFDVHRMRAISSRVGFSETVISFRPTKLAVSGVRITRRLALAFARSSSARSFSVFHGRMFLICSNCGRSQA